MFRWVSRPRPRITAAVTIGLLVLSPTAVRAEPTGTSTPQATAVGGPGPQSSGGQVTTPVIDVLAPTVDVFVVTGNIEGDSTEAESSGRVEVTLGADVLFAFGKADLTPAANQRLAQVAERIRTQAKGTVHVDGHTDSVGDTADNQKLSQRRAETVRNALAALLASTSVTFEVAGHGESKPVAANTMPDGKDNPAGRAKNRRVEIRFEK